MISLICQLCHLKCVFLAACIIMMLLFHELCFRNNCFEVQSAHSNGWCEQTAHFFVTRLFLCLNLFLIRKIILQKPLKSGMSIFYWEEFLLNFWIVDWNIPRKLKNLIMSDIIRNCGVSCGFRYSTQKQTLHEAKLSVAVWHEVLQKYFDCIGTTIQVQFLLQYITGFHLPAYSALRSTYFMDLTV